jgi:hypothetical protein
MATPTPGTIPALPQYQPGALPLAGTEILEIASSANATAAASYFINLLDLVGKAPSAMAGANPTSQDLLAFYQKSSGLYFSSPVGNLAIPSGNLPVAGGTGQILAKNSPTNFDASWDSISTFVQALGTGLIATGATTVIFSLAGPLQVSNLTANGIVVGQGTSALTVIAATTAGLPLVSNGNTSAPAYQVLPASGGGMGTTALTAHGVVLGAGTAALNVTGTQSAGQVLLGQNATADPLWQTIGGALTLNAAGTATLSNITQTIITTGVIFTAAVSDREIYINNATTVTVRIPSGTTWFAADTNGLPLIVLDSGANASAHPITVSFISDTCDGTATLGITTNYGGYRLRPLQTGNWVIV